MIWHVKKNGKIEEGHLMPDHVHMLISIPPKHPVSNVIGFMKGKSAIYIARNLLNRQKKLYGAKFLGARILRKYGWSE